MVDLIYFLIENITKFPLSLFFFNEVKFYFSKNLNSFYLEFIMLCVKL